MTFTVKGDSDAITFTCQKAAGHGRGRQTIHRAGWGLFAQVEWLDAQAVARIFADDTERATFGVDSSSSIRGIRSRHENRE